MDPQKISRDIRKRILAMHHKTNASHIGSSFSCVELLVSLYFSILHIRPEQPDWPQRDRMILSKGHAATALYATLAARGFFPSQALENYYQPGSTLLGHVTQGAVPGVEVSTGSLGHGLALGAGMALAAKHDRQDQRVFVVMSDGECNEGSVWETVMFAVQHKLDNLIAIIDANRIQAYGATRDIIDLDPLAEKFRAFGWTVKETDGHSHKDICGSLQDVPFERGRPSALVAHTVKGKGVSFMENQLAWHYRSPKHDEYEKAMRELDQT